jgi:hypothetical protein
VLDLLSVVRNDALIFLKSFDLLRQDGHCWVEHHIKFVPFKVLAYLELEFILAVVVVLKELFVSHRVLLQEHLEPLQVLRCKLFKCLFIVQINIILVVEFFDFIRKFIISSI